MDVFDDDDFFDEDIGFAKSQNSQSPIEAASKLLAKRKSSVENDETPKKKAAQEDTEKSDDEQDSFNLMLSQPSPDCSGFEKYLRAELKLEAFKESLARNASKQRLEAAQKFFSRKN